MNRDDAVTAVAEALVRYAAPQWANPSDALKAARPDAGDAVATLEPYIAARIADDRERLAAAVEALRDDGDPDGWVEAAREFTAGWNNGVSRAARLVRERP